MHEMNGWIANSTYRSKDASFRGKEDFETRAQLGCVLVFGKKFPASLVKSHYEESTKKRIKMDDLPSPSQVQPAGAGAQTEAPAPPPPAAGIQVRRNFLSAMRETGGPLSRFNKVMIVLLTLATLTLVRLFLSHGCL